MGYKEVKFSNRSIWLYRNQKFIEKYHFIKCDFYEKLAVESSWLNCVLFWK